MKRLIFLHFMILFNDCVFAQSLKKINVPEVKESLKIDSVIDYSVSKINYKKAFILIDLNIHKKFFYFNISCIKWDYPVIDLGSKWTQIDKNMSILKYKDNIRYFKYKRCLVFVTGSHEPYNLFTPTKNAKKFIFSTNGHNVDLSMYLRKISHFEYLVYKDNHFISALVPVY